MSVKLTGGMIKLIVKTITFPLKIIRQLVLGEFAFPDDWKKQCSSNPQERLWLKRENLIKNHYKENNQKCNLFIIKLYARNNTFKLKIINVSAFSIFSVKFIKGLNLTPCSIILYKTKYSLSVSLASYQATEVLLNSYQLLHMKSTNVLIVTSSTI